MVRDVFRLAKENAPAIIFIDEVDAIATARFDAQTGADREVQRILMELLNQVRFLAIMGSLEVKFATSSSRKSGTCVEMEMWKIILRPVRLVVSGGFEFTVEKFLGLFSFLSTVLQGSEYYPF